MMGKRTETQEALFYEFSIERHVPATPLLRSIFRTPSPQGTMQLKRGVSWRERLRAYP